MSGRGRAPGSEARQSEAGQRVRHCGFPCDRLTDLAIGVRDDFFALGGHSLKAFALMAAVRREFGVELPLNPVFRRRTVELLCEALPEAGAAAARLLVPLADGDPSRPPLVLVHPRGGDVVCYRDLVRDLSASPGGDRRILGLESVGYDTGQRPLETVPEMAERYLAALREEQPHGPYLLARWSLGGTMAYEMAARLEAAGEEVAFPRSNRRGRAGRGSRQPVRHGCRAGRSGPAGPVRSREVTCGARRGPSRSS
ncbi:hypothetical protein CP980_34665 [Streptomyces vinaceus]|uniref:Carrier domain-containing protein n=1 Tax=Streptomyces vinaceus TaxID=1960 RepID=A0A5J6JIF7_STRVI|nr:hypothetical protein CP980_34665 [Streptomyces vinaceus]GHE46092.1 hypothetical protein GCM10017778_32390 [Streptomyces vinaceus]